MEKGGGILFVMKRMIAAALACMAIMLPACAGELSGYEKGRGYQYVSFGSYPQGEQGEALPKRQMAPKISQSEADARQQITGSQ